MNANHQSDAHNVVNALKVICLALNYASVMEIVSENNEKTCFKFCLIINQLIQFKMPIICSRLKIIPLEPAGAAFV